MQDTRACKQSEAGKRKLGEGKEGGKKKKIAPPFRWLARSPPQKLASLHCERHEWRRGKERIGGLSRGPPVRLVAKREVREGHYASAARTPHPSRGLWPRRASTLQGGGHRAQGSVRHDHPRVLRTRA